MADSPIPPLNPQQQLNFQSPEAMLVFMEADNILRQIQGSAAHLAMSGNAEYANLFASRAMEWKMFIATFVRANTSVVQIVGANQMPPPPIIKGG